MSKPIVITDEGLKKLEDELNELIVVKRKEIAEQIKQARDYGDLSENSEYDEAKNQQAVVEARIAQIEQMLKNVKLVDKAELNTEKVNIGAKVKVYDEEFDEEITYELVGSTEADPRKNKITYESPVGKALMGHEVGETVDVVTPGGENKLKILEILL
ncbi:transcription elongation factor GreA [Feifania hominis]|uniref:Transcription elongation factor GreA n=1 Tax=Feifania hominis TaxID=2763660 RepID=A0A926HPP5_9FIRM|nr:transcription elongation factor GreA [Feifania hominis]MBC8535487.1 transcription elongation factor GreA [Feifania hominis]